MTNHPRAHSTGLILGLIVVFAAPASAVDLEASLLGSWMSADYGAGDSADEQATVLRLVTGDELQLRLDLPWLRVESTSTVPGGGLGPIPRPPRGGNGNGSPGDGGADQGNGEGNGQGGPTSGVSESFGTLANTQDAVSETTTASGLGDIRLGGSLRLSGGGIKRHRIDAGLDVKLPTADEAEGLGTGKSDYRIGVAGDYAFWSTTAFGGLGWNRLGDPAWVDLNDVIDLYLGLEGLLPGDRVILSGWVEGNPEVVDGNGFRSAVALEIRTLGRYRFRGLLRAGLSGSAEDFTVALGMSFGVKTPWSGALGPAR